VTRRLRSRALESDADRRQVRGLALVVVLVLIVILVRFVLDQVFA